MVRHSCWDCESSSASTRRGVSCVSPFVIHLCCRELEQSSLLPEVLVPDWVKTILAARFQRGQTPTTPVAELLGSSVQLFFQTCFHVPFPTLKSPAGVFLPPPRCLLPKPCLQEGEPGTIQLNPHPEAMFLHPPPSHPSLFPFTYAGQQRYYNFIFFFTKASKPPSVSSPALGAQRALRQHRAAPTRSSTLFLFPISYVSCNTAAACP